MGIPYDHGVDMWSFGCIIYELAKMVPLFPAKEEKELMQMFRITFGKIPQWMIETARKRTWFYDENGKMLKSEKSRVNTD